MSNELLQKLENKIENVVETIELLRMQVEELEANNANLQADNDALKQKHAAWEQNLTTMLEKLDALEPQTQSV